MVSHAELSGRSSLLDDTSARGAPAADLNERRAGLLFSVARSRQGAHRVRRDGKVRAPQSMRRPTAERLPARARVSAVMRNASAHQPNHATARSCCTPSQHARPRIGVARPLNALRLTALRIHTHRSHDVLHRVRSHVPATRARGQAAADASSTTLASRRSSCPSCSRRCWRVVRVVRLLLTHVTGCSEGAFNELWSEVAPHTSVSVAKFEYVHVTVVRCICVDQRQQNMF